MKNKFCLALFILALVLGGMLFRIYEYNSHLEAQVQGLEHDKHVLETNLDRSQDVTAKLRDLITSPEQLSGENQGLSLLAAESLDDIYYMRNEIIYHNKSLTYSKASYLATCMYLISKHNDVDPFLTTAIAMVESNFKQEASSEAGAEGIMQLMPVIARAYNVNPTKLEENLRGGVEFLRDLLDQYDSTKLALAHYNGGSRPYYALDNYDETQKYVKKVRNIYDTMREKYRN